MAELKLKSPCEGLMPVTCGALTLKEVTPGPLTSIAPLKGQEAALSKALKKAHGMNFPAPNESAEGKAGARAIWFGRDMALLTGAAPAEGLAEHAALTDQSAGWAVVILEGPGSEDVLARLCPVDFRLAKFPLGATSRTELKHMMASVTRLDEASFQIMVFRSLAQTLVHDLKTAMEALTARG